MLGYRREKFSIFKMSHNFSIDLRHHIHCESNVLKASTSIATVYFPYVFCQLSSKPADQKNVTNVHDVKKHSLTHIGIISPVLQKKIIVAISQVLKG